MDSYIDVSVIPSPSLSVIALLPFFGPVISRLLLSFFFSFLWLSGMRQGYC